MATHHTSDQHNKAEWRSPQLGFFAVAVSLIALDQFSKYLFEIFISEPFRNIYFAFSLPLPVWLMYAIYCLVISGIVVHLIRNFKHISGLERLAWNLILSGGLSNVIERISLGYVRDFIRIMTGVFNLADFFILTGLLILLFKKNNK